MMPGGPELLIILFLVLIFFGAGRLPQVFDAFGQGVKRFRDAQRDEMEDEAPVVKSIPASSESVDSGAKVAEPAKAERKPESANG